MPSRLCLDGITLVNVDVTNNIITSDVFPTIRLGDHLLVRSNRISRGKAVLEVTSIRIEDGNDSYISFKMIDVMKTGYTLNKSWGRMIHSWYYQHGVLWEHYLNENDIDYYTDVL